jgi:integrase
VSQSYYWEPTPKLRKLGFGPVALGQELTKALEKAAELNRQVATEKAGIVKPSLVRGTFAHLVLTYEKSMDFSELALKTQKNYRSFLEKLGKLQGKNSGKSVESMKLEDITPVAAEKFYLGLKAKHGPAHARHIIHTARSVWNFGTRKGLTPAGRHNPFEGMRIKKSLARRTRWTPEQIRLFCNKADEMGLQAVATAFLLQYTLCQRQGDIIGRWVGGQWQDGLTWDQIAFDWSSVTISQNKTGENLSLPLTPYWFLVERLQALPREAGQPVIVDPQGQPFKTRQFVRLFARIRAAADLPDDLWNMDARATGATELGDSGASLAEIMSHTGHRTAALAMQYTRRTQDQALSAASKRVQNSGNLTIKKNGNDFRQ